MKYGGDELYIWYIPNVACNLAYIVIQSNATINQDLV